MGLTRMSRISSLTIVVRRLSVLCMMTYTLIIGLFSLAYLQPALSQSKYSGIYRGGLVGEEQDFLLALTVGGRALGLSDGTDGLREALDPARSRVNKKGKFTFRTPDGRVLAGRISKKGRATGTVREGNRTARFALRRAFR